MVGMNEHINEGYFMSKENKIWVAVKVERGFISTVKAYKSKSLALNKEKSWRNKINPDYDETAIKQVKIR